jgi:uncharacterized protein (DUF952 family)
VKRFVYRVLDLEEWLNFKKKKVFIGNDLDQRSGYIHLSQKDQLRKTIDIYFKKKKIVILKIRTKNLKQKLLWETSREGEKFPHLYDKLSLESVVKADYPNV